jgi:hypothetical protein
MASFPKEQKALDRARQALATKVNAHFPVGCKVVVYSNEGRSRMFGVVAFEATDGYVRLRHHKSGRVHHRHYSDVERAD